MIRIGNNDHKFGGVNWTVRPIVITLQTNKMTQTTTQVRGVWTNDAGSMAAETARTRWPNTVQNMIDDVSQTAASTSGKVATEGQDIAAALTSLKADIESDAQLRPIENDGEKYVQLYNAALAELGNITWRAAPWLYAECHIYRSVQTFFSTSRHWRGYDVFKRQKDSTFADSRVAIEELTSRYLEVVASARKEDLSGLVVFEEMTQIALWGNATDLSLLSKLSLEEIQSLQGSAAIKNNQRNIIANDVELVWRHLKESAGGRVDIVLDNSGFELFTDLIYASYLLKAGLATSIILHVKDFPWFVSDVTPQDMMTTMKDLGSCAIFPNRDRLDPLVAILRTHLDSHTICIQQHAFWTAACPFDQLPEYAPDLLEDLRQSNLVIFKGDLNYRKLVADGLWPYTTPFKAALGRMGQGSGVKILSLRTNKADVCVGVPDEETVKRLDAEAPGFAWTRSGKYAVISFSDGQ